MRSNATGPGPTVEATMPVVTPVVPEAVAPPTAVAPIVAEETPGDETVAEGNHEGGTHEGTRNHVAVDANETAGERDNNVNQGETESGNGSLVVQGDQG